MSDDNGEMLAKSCFVIAPIGGDESPTRKRSDQVLNHVIKPVLEPLGYCVERADQIADPGMIDSQILQRIVESDLVVTDLTEHNPNVFYELAVRHMLARPAITLIAKDESLPFDVIQNRTIRFDHTDLDSVAAAKKHLLEAVQASERSQVPQENPVSFAVNLARLLSSDDPGDQSAANILEMRSDLLKGFTRLEQLLQQDRFDDEELFRLLYAHVVHIGRGVQGLRVEVYANSSEVNPVDADDLDLQGMVDDVLVHARSMRSLLRERLPEEDRTATALKSYHQQRRRLVELDHDSRDE